MSEPEEPGSEPPGAPGSATAPTVTLVPTEIRAPLWTAAVVLASAAYAFFVLVLRARGLTFYWDDWIHIDHCLHVPRPTCWLVSTKGMWNPGYVALLDLEYALFGANHTFFLVTTWAIHTGNVFLLARLLGRWTGDDRAAAVATAFFGLSTSWREVLFWAEFGGLALAFAFVLLSLLALDRAVERGGRWLLLLGGAVFVGLIFHPIALPIGPLLAVMALRAEGPSRRSAAGAALVACLVYVLLYLVNKAGGTSPLPRTPGEVAAAASLFFHLVGSGIVERSWLVPGGESLAFAIAYTSLYVLATAAVMALLRPRERTRVALLQVHVFTYFAFVAVGRFFFVPSFGAATESRYQYAASLAWVATLAFFLAWLARRQPRAALGGAAILALAGSLVHARVADTMGRATSPEKRRDQVVFVHELEEAALSARGPIYDVPLPSIFPDTIRARAIVEILHGPLAVTWTDERTPESIAPYLKRPLLRANLRSQLGE
ncbi:hypothetical protein HY251_15445 [bacterium]|nr:hypothetical protein [bacterium]